MLEYQRALVQNRSQSHGNQEPTESNKVEGEDVLKFWSQLGMSQNFLYMMTWHVGEHFFIVTEKQS